MVDIEYLKQLYILASSKKNEFKWKPLYPNNMPCNGQDGIYTDFSIKQDDGTYKYYKFTIQYVSRCDARGISHNEEGTKYYVLHMYDVGYFKPIEIKEPSDTLIDCRVNDYGRFRYVFDDEDTAKSVARMELLHIIYPYTYIMSDEEQREWKEFVKNYGY